MVNSFMDKKSTDQNSEVDDTTNLNQTFESYVKGDIDAEMLLRVEKKYATDYANATLEATSWWRKQRIRILSILAPLFGAYEGETIAKIEKNDGFITIKEKESTSGRS
jgi:hypothetical protein